MKSIKTGGIALRIVTRGPITACAMTPPKECRKTSNIPISNPAINARDEIKKKLRVNRT
jgi:hypothetical protein